MAQWRATYRALPEVHQIIAATIIWLYRGGPDTVWLRRVAVAWPAAEAIALLRSTGALPDWGLLVLSIPAGEGPQAGQTGTRMKRSWFKAVTPSANPISSVTFPASSRIALMPLEPRS